MTTAPTPAGSGGMLVAALWMSGAIISFTLMAIAGRAVSIELDTFEILMFRSFIGVAVVVCIGGAMGRLGSVRVRKMKWHAARNVSHFFGQNLWFYALTAAPLAQVFAMEFSQPLWVALAAPFFLGERLSRARWLAIIMGFVGILVVARPGFQEISPGLVAAAVAAIGFAGSTITTKHLTRTETVTSIMFWLTVMQSVLGLVCAGIDGDIHFPSAAAWPWLVIIALGGLVAHLCITQALSVAPATIVIPFDFARLPVIAVVGMLLYHEPLDAMVFVGGVIVFCANLANVRLEANSRKTVVAQ